MEDLTSLFLNKLRQNVPELEDEANDALYQVYQQGNNDAAANNAAQLQQALPAIQQQIGAQAVQAAISPENKRKKEDIYKQTILNSLLGGTQQK